ncbi:MAG: 2'-5' RNA ligase family protein [Acidobacteriota bacterium]
MDLPHRGAERINSYALVTYIPDPLASFLNNLREELEAAGPAPRAHVTLLPPRPIQCPTCDAVRQVGEELAAMDAFELGLGEPELFPGTNVVYISIASGLPHLEHIHTLLNEESLGFNEPFPYHPHVTLAQGLSPSAAPRALELARLRWAQFPHSHSFLAESVVFVQNTLDNQWLDLAQIHLGARNRQPAPVMATRRSRH